MIEEDIIRDAQEDATWWYFNVPHMDQEAVTQRAGTVAHDMLYGDGGLMREFHSIPISWEALIRDAFIAEYQRLQAGHTHGPGLITDLAEIRKTLDGLPAITPDIVLCPTCWTRLQWLQGAQIWSCPGCHVLLTADAVTASQNLKESHYDAR